MGDIPSSGRWAGKSGAQELGVEEGNWGIRAASADLLNCPPRSQQGKQVSSEHLFSEVPSPSSSCFITNTLPLTFTPVSSPCSDLLLSTVGGAERLG